MKISLSNTTVRYIIFAFLVCAVIYFVSSCEKSYGPPLEDSVNLEGIPILVTTIFYDDRNVLAAEFLKNQSGGEEPSSFEVREWVEDNKLDGFASLSYPRSIVDGDPNAGTPTCTIHTLRIRGQKDYDRNEVLGHEMLHCVRGNWHPPYSEFR